MMSMRSTCAIIILAVSASALSLFASRDVEVSMLLAGLTAVLAILTVSVLLLAEIVDAVQGLVRDNSAKNHHESSKQCEDAVTLAPHAHHLRMVIAAVESVSRSKAVGGAIASQNPTEPRCKLVRMHVIGSHVDFVIPSDRAE